MQVISCNQQMLFYEFSHAEEIKVSGYTSRGSHFSLEVVISLSMFKASIWSYAKSVL